MVCFLPLFCKKQHIMSKLISIRLYYSTPSPKKSIKTRNFFVWAMLFSSRILYHIIRSLVYFFKNFFEKLSKKYRFFIFLIFTLFCCKCFAIFTKNRTKNQGATSLSSTQKKPIKKRLSHLRKAFLCLLKLFFQTTHRNVS